MISRLERLYNDGVKNLLDEKFEKAVDLFDECLKTAPDFSGAYDAKGLAFMRRADRDLKVALSCFDKAISADPGSATSWEHKGHALGQLGGYTEALYCLERAISLTEPLAKTENAARELYISALNDEAWILIDGFSEFDKAIECCNKILDIDHGHQDAKQNVKIAIERKRHGQALTVSGIKNCPYCKAITYYWAKYCPTCGRMLHLP